MTGSDKEILAVQKALDHLEGRIRDYRKILFDLSVAKPVQGDPEESAVTTGEVETIEALILRLALRLTGAEPIDKEWEPMDSYCSRNKTKQDNWADDNREYFRWGLLWIQKSRAYLAYLGGLENDQ